MCTALVAVVMEAYVAGMFIIYMYHVHAITSQSTNTPSGEHCRRLCQV